MNHEQQNESLEDLVARLEIKRWDWLLFGDGSGSTYDLPCGWGCISIERRTWKRELWHGSMSRGTVNMAEMMAYLQPLNWIATTEAARIEKDDGMPRSISHVHIITDSKYVATYINKRSGMPKRNGAMWKMFTDFERHGIVLHAHHMVRESTLLNIYVDAVSKAARQNVIGTKFQVFDPTTVKPVTSIYNCNPTIGG